EIEYGIERPRTHPIIDWSTARLTNEGGEIDTTETTPKSIVKSDDLDLMKKLGMFAGDEFLPCRASIYIHHMMPNAIYNDFKED
ncbi:hypothetical protein ACJX0J_023999, partial [Zea mays]